MGGGLAAMPLYRLNYDMKNNSQEVIERFKSLPLYILRSLLTCEKFEKQTKIILEKIIKEKEVRPNADQKTNNAFYNGNKINEVQFVLNDFVEIGSGFEMGKFGSVISLVSLEPEPIYHIEIDGNEGEREIPQSSLRIIH